nr:acyltransferase family protein [Catenovulum maritimum]
MSNGSVLFVFIAGYLFQHLSVKYSPNKYYINKLKNVILPYLIISIPAIIVFVYFQQRERVWESFYDNPEWLQIIYFYLTGRHLAPLWFVPMISIFFLISPLLIAADKNKKIYYLLPIFLLISCWIERGLPYISFIHFFSAYLLGMFCSHFKHKLNPILSQPKTLLLLGSMILAFALGEFFFMKGTMTWVNYLQKISACLFFLGLLIYYGDKLTSPIINVVANASFGIFFIHSYVLTAGKLSYTQLVGDLPSGNPVLHIVITLSTLFLCVSIILGIQKLFGRSSRYLIGS